jgi:hypothetical protein
VEGVRIEPIDQATLNEVQQHLEEIGCQTRQGSYYNGENEQHLSLAQSLCDVEKPTVNLLPVGLVYVVRVFYHYIPENN